MDESFREAGDDGGGLLSPPGLLSPTGLPTHRLPAVRALSDGTMSLLTTTTVIRGSRAISGRPVFQYPHLHVPDCGAAEQTPVTCSDCSRACRLARRRPAGRACCAWQVGADAERRLSFGAPTRCGRRAWLWWLARRRPQGYERRPGAASPGPVGVRQPTLDVGTRRGRLAGPVRRGERG